MMSVNEFLHQPAGGAGFRDVERDGLKGTSLHLLTHTEVSKRRGIHAEADNSGGILCAWITDRKARALGYDWWYHLLPRCLINVHLMLMLFPLSNSFSLVVFA